MDNISSVQAIYEAFGRGDVPAILAMLSPDVVFDRDAEGVVPWLAHREGRDEVAEFFASLGALDVHAFAPRNLMAAGEQVAATIHIEATVKATGVDLPVDEVHLWTFGPDGLVSEL